MKTIFALFALTMSLITCKAQQVYPLNADFDKVPEYSYLKDLNNELSPYLGTYKATYNGNEITLVITKEDKKLIELISKKYYQDALIVKYTVKNMATGTLLDDNLNPTGPDKKEIISMGTNALDSNSLSLGYDGTTCGIGWGKIILKKINNTQFTWDYRPNSSIFSGNDCPDSKNIKVYLLDTENLIFTKQ
ncbi:DUF6705 family protein [Chryseobacterium sp.]|uniref:DUF6705 family protein n=1 Tax=Chryseobacterium sp. TaxID=1871047 RepID=UPI0025C517EF|nr:DUF6705 family protein [Chryseobacterium sp.]